MNAFQIVDSKNRTNNYFHSHAVSAIYQKA
jgi:hypothetical protein